MIKYKEETKQQLTFKDVNIFGYFYKDGYLMLKLPGYKIDGENVNIMIIACNDVPIEHDEYTMPFDSFPDNEPIDGIVKEIEYLEMEVE